MFMVYRFQHEVSISEGFIESVGPQLLGDTMYGLYDTE